jgi:hypothetical protein
VLAGRYNDPSASRLPDRLLLEYIIPSIRNTSVPASPACTP